ncbi:MAG: tRNA adenosine(34) deaminase TadA [Clostridiales bacterium]|nr:tRNA adenosine(34) deaminase TadA [Clostridiales bacterium]
MKVARTNAEEKFMRIALAEARKAARAGEIPVGAVIVLDDKVLTRAHNQPIKRHDPTAHAEIVAIRKASRMQKNYRLPGCDLYVTLEPCAMCLGAAVQARIRRLVYGAADPKAGAVQSIMSFPFERTNHQPEVRAGLLAQESAALLKDFFKQKRHKHKALD